MRKIPLSYIFTSALCVTALCGGASLYAALRFDYDISMHHFAVGSPWAAAAAVICVLGLLIAAAQAGIAHFTHAKSVPAPVGSAAVFAASLTGFLLLAGTLLGFMRYSDLNGGWLERIRLALMALSAFYFLAAVPRAAKAPLSALCAIFSLAPIPFAFLSVMSVYFDAEMAMNSPLKVYLLMMYLAMALFFTAEARLTLGRTHTVSYILLAGLCTVLCGAVGAATLAVSLFDTQGFSLPLIECAAALAVGIFAALRLFSMKNPEEASSDAHAEPIEND